MYANGPDRVINVKPPLKPFIEPDRRDGARGTNENGGPGGDDVAGCSHGDETAEEAANDLFRIDCPVPEHRPEIAGNTAGRAGQKRIENDRADLQRGNADRTAIKPDPADIEHQGPAGREDRAVP